MKSGRWSLHLIAALCLSGAAIVTSVPAQRRANSRTPRAATKPTPTPAPALEPTPTPLPAPGKANSRPDAPPEPTRAPQTAAAKNAKTDETPAAPRYFYEFTQPNFYLRHVQIEHDAAGRGQITFERKADEEPLTEPLQLAPAALQRIAAAWGALHFLDSTEDYQTDRQMAHLGTIRLRQTEGARTRTAEFNWTHNPDAAALMNEYRRVADQQLFVFEIGVARQYQPSDSVKLLKGLESLVERGAISDGPQLLPLLNDLATDERIPLIARNQAAQLAKKIEKQAARRG
ncbi:MAG TPA: hypothetical protein VF546_10215 [Pyrinomonadaceae bacterium]|jgi:hypothetical protein